MAAIDNVPCQLSAGEFANFVLTQLPVYESEILRNVRPTDMLAAHVSSGQWDPFSGTEQTQDRFTTVYPNTTAKWEDISEASCEGAPCDPVDNYIGWGYKRLTFGQERQSWRSQMICFDQQISMTKAVEHFAQIISDILRPASAAITSTYVRKKELELAGRKLLANATMSSFTFTWETDGNQEIFMTPSALPTSKLTPQMLMRQIPYMRNIGYFGKWTNDPFWGGYDQFAELLTDDDTLWELDRMATAPTVSNAWRFTDWNAAHEYYKYGMGGQFGNYMVRIDPFALRFNLNTNAPGGTTKLQLVLPYRNDAVATAGLNDTVNEDYLNAQYQISFIHHRFGWQLLTQQMQSINPLMPFLVRDLSGKWQFAIDNLGADCNGVAIPNYRRNKGFFYADWRLAGRPLYTEFITAILHLREPQVLYAIAPCAADPGYPAQTYNSANDECGEPLRWIPAPDPEGSFVLAANTVTCDSGPLNNGAIDAATLEALVTALEADLVLGAIGDWSQDGTYLILENYSCVPVLPWVTTA